jgi:transcriptional regulator with XRE-family HTH domain
MTKEFGDWITKKYLGRGWTMRELSRRANLSISYVSAIISGDKEPGAKLFLGLAQSFDIPINDIQRIAKGEKEDTMTDWLDELRQHREAKQAQDQPAPEPPPLPDLLSQCKAHDLLRQAQKALLNGEGLLNAPVSQAQYERVMTLVWQGPVYAARKPQEDDPEEMYYILVGGQKRAGLRQREKGQSYHAGSVKAYAGRGGQKSGGHQGQRCGIIFLGDDTR